MNKKKVQNAIVPMMLPYKSLTIVSLIFLLGGVRANRLRSCSSYFFFNPRAGQSKLSRMK